MKCSKCGYTTFDIYEFCPKCRNDFTMARDTLGLLKYTLTDSNNYLIDPVEPFTENNFRERETLSSSPMAEQQLTGNNELGEINNIPAPEENADKDDNGAITLEDVDHDEIVAALENFEEKDDNVKTDELGSELENFTQEDDGEISLEDIGLDDLLETNREE